MDSIPPARILIVDDESSMRELLSIALEPEGHVVRAVADVAAAREAMAAEPFDLVVSDIAMPGESGLDLLAEIRRAHADLPVILITAYASMESASRAFALGVYDCMDKGASFNNDEFRARVRHALAASRTLQENRLLRRQLRQRYGPGTLVWVSRAMQRVKDLIERAAPTASTVLITGESGTGKEVVARALHARSPRAEAPFISVNCGGLPSELLESELFGHVRGAFTGAATAKKGLFEAARGGTIFLDEIGEMSPAAQVRLLRVLQERTIRLVGGTEETPVDVRIIAATNADLAARVADRSFREDLYYRINVIRIALPPLRERREDIPPLAQTFARAWAEETGRPFSGFAPETVRALESHQWPGNVRELENAVQRALLLSPGPIIGVESLPLEVAGAAPAEPAAPATAAPGAPVPKTLPEGVSIDQYLDGLKADLMRRALEESGHVQMEAARRLGMSFRSFRYFVRQFDLETRARRRRATGEAGEDAAPSADRGPGE